MSKSDNIISDGNICPTGEIVIKYEARILDYKGRIIAWHWDYWNKDGILSSLYWKIDLE